MNEVFETIIFILTAVASFYLARLAGKILESRICGNSNLKESQDFFSMVLGFSALIGVSGSVFFNGKSIAIILIILLAGLLIIKRKSGVWRWQFRPDSWLFWFAGLLLLNLGLRFLFLFDFQNGKFHTLLDDQYSYLENYVLMHMFGKEMHVGELINQVYGYSPDFKPYHYAEFYLTWLFDTKNSKLSDFKIFQLFTNSFLLTYSQLTLVALGRFLFPGRRVQELVVMVLLIFYACQFSVFLNFFFYLPVSNALKSATYYFPMQAITSDLFVSAVMPNSSVKFSTFFIIVSVFVYAFQVKRKEAFLLGCVMTLVVNYSFAPFLVVLTCLFLYQEKEHFLWYGVFPSLLFLFLMAFGGSGLKNSEDGISFFYDLSFSIFQTKAFLSKYFRQFSGNFYNFFLSILALILIRKRNKYLVLIFLILIAYPFVFLIEAKWQAKIQWIYGFGIPIILYFIFKRALNPKIFYPFFVASAVLGLIIFILIEKNDFWQLFYFPFCGSLYFLTFLLLNREKVQLLPATFLLLLQLFSTNFYFKRFYFRDSSSNPFVEQFLSRIPDKVTLSAFVSDPFDPAFLVLEKEGFDIQNEFDSLFTTFISIENIDRADSIKIMKRGIFDLYNHLPINRFKTAHPDLNLQECKLKFIKEKGIPVIFRSYQTDRKHLDFLNPYLTDSLNNPVEQYQVYFLNPGLIP